MSYIVAFVNFKESSEFLYPVDCTRDDLVPGDKVIVRTKDQRTSVAFVSKLDYMGWKNGAEIICKLSEASQNAHGDYIVPEDAPYEIGYAVPNTLVNNLHLKGWELMRSANKTYSLVIGKKNQTQTVFILFRKNGIDIQLLDSKNYEVKKCGTWATSTTEGRMVRNYYARTDTNLYQWIESFATDFDNNKKNLEKYFIPQGSKHRKRMDTDYIPAGDLLVRLLDEASDCNHKDESYPIKGNLDGKVSLGDGLYMDISGIGNIGEYGGFLDAEEMYDCGLDPFYRKDRSTGQPVERKVGLNPICEENYTDRQKTAKKESPRKFHDFQEAREWGIANPGRTITRPPDRRGYIEKIR